MKYHEMNREEVEETLNTDLSSGLTSDDVKARLKQYGKNELEEGEIREDQGETEKTEQFGDFIIFIIIFIIIIIFFFF